MEVTLKEISTRAGVSISTVSRVLKNDPRISESTKEKVLRVAKKLGHPIEPGSISSNRVIMFFVSNPHRSIESDEFFSGVQRGILQTSSGEGLHCLVQSMRSRSAFDESLIPVDLVEGLIVGGIPMPESMIHFLMSLKIPTVLIGKYCGLESFPSVNNDNVRGGYLASYELLKNKYEKITVITGPMEVSTFADRLEGFFKGLKENNYPEENVRIIECNSFEERDGKKFVEREYIRSERREAIFCTTDWLAKGVMEAFFEQGVAIPGQVGVIGFGGLDFTRRIRPRLTTIALNPYLLGKIATVMLSELIEGNDEARGVVFVEPYLLKGETLKGGWK